MIKNIISLVVMLISFDVSLKHGWDALNHKNNPAATKMMSELEVNSSLVANASNSPMYPIILFADMFLNTAKVGICFYFSDNISTFFGVEIFEQRWP